MTYGETFGSVPPGELVAYTDATGQVALAVNSGNAAQRLGLPPGAHVRLTVAH
jgi:S-adenosylmethionine hydrolase